MGNAVDGPAEAVSEETAPVTRINRLSSVTDGDPVIAYTRKLRVVVARPDCVDRDRDAAIISRAMADFQLEVTCTRLDQRPEKIVETVVDRGADALALPILCATHLALLPRIAELFQDRGFRDIFMTLGEPSRARAIAAAPRWPSAHVPAPREIIASIEARLGPVPAQAISAIRSARPIDAIWVFFALGLASP
jgi:methylmalonyl-CoA mutase cobalamin-binding domain/chain